MQASIVDWQGLLQSPLFRLGEKPVTLATLVLLAASLVGLLLLSRCLQHLLLRRLLAHSHLSPGTQQAIGTLVRYAVLVLGLLLVLQTAGINLSAFSVVAGAVGVGVGFGLQNIFSNFISGLIVMIERPVKVGDRIEVAGIEGDVLEIGARATRLRTARHTTVIVPNQKLIVENVKNWQSGNGASPLSIAVKVARDEDPQKIESLLLELASGQPGVLQDPPARVYMAAIDASGLSFELEAWIGGDTRSRMQMLSRLNFGLRERLAAGGIRTA